MPSRVLRVTSLVVLALFLATPARGEEPGLPATVAPGAELTEVYDTDAFLEGPAWDPGTGKLYFTSFKKRHAQILRLDEPGKAAVWWDGTEGIGGLWSEAPDVFVATQAYGHRLLRFRIGADGPEDRQVLYHNPDLNQPNDLCQTADGRVYFTDPDFGKRETSAVYLYRPGESDEKGSVAKVIDDMDVPNGVIASLDGKTLYVGDSHRKHWRSYPVRDDGGVGPGRVFFEPDVENDNPPDGMSIDERGNLYFTGRGGVWAVAPDGKPLGLVAVPEFMSNCTFGGPDGKTLYMVGSKKAYSLRMQVRGGQFADR